MRMPGESCAISIATIVVVVRAVEQNLDSILPEPRQAFATSDRVSQLTDPVNVRVAQLGQQIDRDEYQIDSIFLAHKSLT